MRAVPHLVIGPAEHGVVRYARDLATATASPEVLTIESIDPTLPLHVHFTDRLFGTSAAAAAERFESLAAAHSCSITVTLHDLPQPSDGTPFAARTAAYRRIVHCARGVVVSSDHERLLMIEAEMPTDSVRVIPLAVDFPVPLPTFRPPTGREIAVLGFIYPGKGHREVIEAVRSLETDAGIVAIGAASLGHDDLVSNLRAHAGNHLRVTGYLPDHELFDVLQSVAVPVAHHRHLSASGSINTWISAGRRPLVPRGRYVDEIESRSPGSLSIYEDSQSALRSAIEAALTEPRTTWLASTFVPYPSMEQVAQMYADAFEEWTS